MSKQDAIAWIKKTKIVPVIRASSPDLAFSVVKSLLDGGIDVLEITMTVPGAIDLIHEVAVRFGSKALIGAGTVYDAETAEKCVGAGAQFIVGPCIDLPTLDYCSKHDILVAPGALTPTEIISAQQAGADIVKVFPCDSVGGVKYVKSLRAPFPNAQLMPTGGVNLENAGDFLRAGAIAVGVGNSLVDPLLIQEGHWSGLTDRAIAFRESVS